MFKMDCRNIHDECVALCATQFPNQNADFPTNMAPLPLNPLSNRNSDTEAQRKEAKEDL